MLEMIALLTLGRLIDIVKLVLCFHQGDKCIYFDIYAIVFISSI